jgi:hypothetical protein
MANRCLAVCREGSSTPCERTGPVYLLTVHHASHNLEKAVNDFKGLHCGYPSLVLGESVQPLKYGLDIFLSKELFNKLFCVSLS